MLKHIPFYASLLGLQIGEKQATTQGHVLVYGAIEAHSMGEKGCIASNKKIATETGLSPGRVANLISELNHAEWVKVNLNANNQRENIVPLLTLHADVNPPSRESEPPLHADVNIDNNIENNENKNNKKISADDKLNVEKLYRGWLIEMVIGWQKWEAAKATPGLRSSLLEKARKKVRLTEKRHRKMLLRQQELGMTNCIKAIKNLSKSDWHKGENDRNWKASIEWLFNSTEKTEEWANK